MPRRSTLRKSYALGIMVGVASLGWWAYHLHGARALMPPPEPGTGEVRLGDFESPSELGRGWRARGVDADLTAEHATHGGLAVRLRFPATRSPAFRLELQPSDWARYGSLEFDLASGARGPQRILVRLTDQAGGAYQEEVHLLGGASEHVSLDLDEARLYLDLQRVTELSFFRWRPSEAATFYLDAVVLRPGPTAAGRSATHGPGPTLRRTPPTDRWQPGWVTSLVKLSPEPANLESLEPGPVSLSLARGERESAQVVLVGTRDRAVRVSLDRSAPRSGRSRRHSTRVRRGPAGGLGPNAEALVPRRPGR